MGSFSSSESRVIETSYIKKSPEKIKTGKKTGLQARTPTPVPAIIHACKGSREVGLKVYEKLLIDKGFLEGVFVSWEKHIIYLNTTKCFYIVIRHADMKSATSYFNKHCQRLAVDKKNFCNAYVDFIPGIHFPKMTVFILVDDLDVKPCKICKRRLLLRLEQHESNNTYERLLSQFASKHKQVQRAALMRVVRPIGPMVTKE